MNNSIMDLSGWVQINMPPSEISVIKQSAKDYTDSVADETGSHVAGTIDDENVVIMFDE